MISGPIQIHPIIAISPSPQMAVEYQRIFGSISKNSFLMFSSPELFGRWFERLPKIITGVPKMVMVFDTYTRHGDFPVNFDPISNALRLRQDIGHNQDQVIITTDSTTLKKGFASKGFPVYSPTVLHNALLLHILLEALHGEKFSQNEFDGFFPVPQDIAITELSAETYWNKLYQALLSGNERIVSEAISEITKKPLRPGLKESSR